MKITAKELSSLLGLSEAAISLALRGKSGVSLATRKRVLAAAEQYGFDFSRSKASTDEALSLHGSVYLIIYRQHGAIVNETQFFSKLCEGISMACKIANHRFCIYHINGEQEIDEQLSRIVASGCLGIILLGTELREEGLAHFKELRVPWVLLDSYFDQATCNCVTINNAQGAFLATEYLIVEYGVQPGYLHSSYPINNFQERSDGFYKVLRQHGMSASHTIVHHLAPSVEGAMADMLALLDAGEKPQRCYFADNDLIAMGAIRACKARGYHVPKDVAIIGFDDVSSAALCEPPLTTIYVPKQYLGEVAMQRVQALLQGDATSPVKIEVSTRLIKRQSA
jgi:LacI family transcriptional regulator